jgi:very-short-patch-repair endonuclease
MNDLRGEVLVAIVNNLRDWHFAYDELWYRIPVDSVERFLKRRWPPQWLAFYRTKAFGGDRYTVRYYGQVLAIERKTRPELFPNEPPGPKSDRVYYRLQLAPLQQLPQPIPSPRWRRITFIPTTWAKIVTATEINDLYDGSPLEDQLWAVLKGYDLPIIRQEWVEFGDRRYALDFAVFCVKAPLAIETDGDRWHHTPELADKDNLRDNDLKSAGWQVLHFNTRRVMEEAETYCVPTIVDTINSLGGVDHNQFVHRLVDPDPDNPRQPSLFD